MTSARIPASELDGRGEANALIAFLRIVCGWTACQPTNLPTNLPARRHTTNLSIPLSIILCQPLRIAAGMPLASISIVFVTGS